MYCILLLLPAGHPVPFSSSLSALVARLSLARHRLLNHTMHQFEASASSLMRSSPLCYTTDEQTT